MNVKTLACVILGLVSISVHAQGNYPNRPIKLVVGFVAGGVSDVMARILAPELQKALGQPVLVENKPGAAGIIGADHVAKSAPDGYTLALMDVGNLAISPSLYKLPFQVPNDFAPITMVAYSPHLLVVPSKLPVNNVAELVAYAKAQNGKVNFAAAAGMGSSVVILALVQKPFGPLRQALLQ